MTSFVDLLTKGNNELPIHERLVSVMEEMICEKMLRASLVEGLALC